MPPRTLADVLSHVEELDWEQVLFLPGDSASWTPTTPALVVPQDEVDDDDLHPAAEAEGMRYVLTVGQVQDIVANALAQSAGAPTQRLLDALRYYVENDAFADLSGR